MSRYLYVVIFTVLIGLVSEAQINIIAGYDVSPASVSALDEVLKDFNETYQHVDPFGEIRIMHGFIAGLRYKHRIGAFELAYYRHLNSQNSTRSLVPVNDANLISDTDFFYEMRTYSFATQLGHEVHIGANIDRNTFVTEMDYGNSAIRDVKIKQRNWGGRLFAGLTLGRRTNISITTRVFYRFLLSDLPTSSLREAVGLGAECTTCNFRPEVFGFSIIINNGPQE